MQSGASQLMTDSLLSNMTSGSKRMRQRDNDEQGDASSGENDVSGFFALGRCAHGPAA